MTAMNITMRQYDYLAENGARVLFDLKHYRVMDGCREDKESYFIIDFITDQPQFYRISQSDCYDLIAMKICGDVADDYIQEMIEDLIMHCCTININ